MAATTVVRTPLDRKRKWGLIWSMVLVFLFWQSFAAAAIQEVKAGYEFEQIAGNVLAWILGLVLFGLALVLTIGKHPKRNLLLNWIKLLCLFSLFLFVYFLAPVEIFGVIEVLLLGLLL